MIKIVVTEIDMSTYKHLRHLKFYLDGGKDFCYRSRVSFNAFAYSKHKYNQKRNKLLYYCTHETDRIGLSRLDIRVPVVELDTLWDFYKFIGYDYKSKKWIS